MEELIASFADIVHDPYKRLTKWKKRTGKKIIGCFPMYVPEEIIHAAGMLPVTVVDSDEAITQADRYLPIYTCHIVRSTFDLALKGELDLLDGIVFPDICEPIQMIADTWNIHRPVPFHHNLTVPINLTSSRGRKYLIEQFENLKASLEKSFGQEITEQAIRQSIAVYNRNRTLMSRLYEFRRSSPASIRAKDVATVVAASMLMPKEEHSQLLERLLAALEKGGKPSNGKVRLVLSGCLCDMPDLDILDLLEELGAVVIDDDLYFGNRYFITLVDESLPPIEALAKRYVNDVPCSTKYNPPNDYADYLMDIVKRSKADAVVMLNLKYCEPYAHEYPHLKGRLSKAGIPELLIELDHGNVSLGQIRTRLQALIELVGEK